MADRVALVALLWTAALGGLWLLRRQSPLHLVSLALLSTALVGSFYPLGTLLVRHTTWRNLLQPSEPLMLATQADFLAWMLGLLAACGCAALVGGTRRSPSVDPEPAPPRVRQRDLVIASGLVLVGAALYGAYVMKIGLGPLLDRDNYGEKYRVSSGLGPLVAGIKVAIAGCLWAEAGALSPRARWAFRLVACAIALWTIAFISVRNNLVVLLAGYGVIVCARRRIELRRIRPWMVAGLLVAYFVLEAFAQFRGAYRGDIEGAIGHIASRGAGVLASAVGGSELSHPFVTALEVRQGYRAGELQGSSYVGALTNLVPLAIHPDRPPVLSEVFVRRFYPDFASRGGGTAFSQVAEAWLNFGPLVGPFAVALALGALLFAVERARRRTPVGLVPRLAPYFPFLVIILHRSETATLVKHVVQIAAPAALLWIVADLIWLGTARASRARRPEPPEVAESIRLRARRA